MKAIGVILSVLIWIIMAGIPLVIFANIASSDLGVNLPKYYPISFTILLLSMAVYGAIWIHKCSKFEEWFQSKLK